MATTTTAVPIGTKEDPIPLATPVPAGDWELTVDGYEPNQNVDFNMFNEPAPAGQVIVRVHFTAKYTGRQVEGSPRDIQVNLVTPAGTTVEAWFVAPGIGVDPMVIGQQAETRKGDVVDGFIYYSLPAADVGAPLLGFAPNVTYSDVPGGVVFFRIT